MRAFVGLLRRCLPFLTAAWAPSGLIVIHAQVPVRSLLRPDARLSEPLVRITGIHELRDGRVIAVDANEQEILLVDFARGTSTRLGRIGSGPREYRFPTRVLRLGGDSVAIADHGNRRLLVVTGAGRLSGVLGPLGLPIGDQASTGVEPPVASDGRGRFYALGSTAFAPATSQPADSAPIERWSLGSRVRDTIAYVPLPPPSRRVLQPGEGTRAFDTEPQWTVGLDGRVAILHVAPFAVDLINANGTRLQGKKIPYQRIPVSQAHKQAWKDDWAPDRGP